MEFKRGITQKFRTLRANTNSLQICSVALSTQLSLKLKLQRSQGTQAKRLGEKTRETLTRGGSAQAETRSSAQVSVRKILKLKQHCG